MLSRKGLRDSRQLRESYIEISNYFRGCSQIPPRRRLRCHHRSPHARFLTSSISRRTPFKDIEENLAATGGDVTKGFPPPPPPDYVHTSVLPVVEPSEPEEVPLKQQLAGLGIGDEVGTGQLDARIPPDTREFLNEYKRKHFLVNNAFPWESLQTWTWFDNLPTSSARKEVPVRLYGFITSERVTRKQTFYQLVDPKLRLAVQVVVPRLASPARDETVIPVSGEDEITTPVGAVESDSPSLAQNPSDASNADSAYGDNSPKSNPTVVKTKTLDSFQPHTPVLISGHLVHRKSAPPPQGAHALGKDQSRSDQHRGQDDVKISRRNVTTREDPFVGRVNLISHVEIHAELPMPLNTMPLQPLANVDTVLGPERRYLQFRTDDGLRSAIRIRSKIMATCRKFLFMKGFDEIETPLLFKSTPEGAREFIVPTRTKGMAYALPQSPQQYKQILMASGISRYFQFAKCFRDEDMRADRQPEFTQLDLEMSFASSEDVMILVERLVAQSIWPAVDGKKPPFEAALARDPPIGLSAYPPDTKLLFPRYTYHQVMSRYGSDKPDPRFGSEIHRVEDWIPSSLKAMLSPLEDPIVEIMKLDMHRAEVKTSSDFVNTFLDAASSAVYIQNPEGTPGVTIFNPLKPLNGLASFGHDAAAKVQELLNPEIGDIIIVQTRKREPFTGGSTMLGNLRRELLQAGVDRGFQKEPKHDSMIWVTDFPLFSPIKADDSAPGQDGSAGICSTHHPFTAPRSDQDLTKLYTDPLSIIGDHYDLVINGVEVGGGSRRIHNPKMQKLIFSDVLKMREERIADFRHLLRALDSGCPPHAGFALGFDRLLAVALRKASVRDVIAFPKWGAQGRDDMVMAPARMSEEVLKTYHLKLNQAAQQKGRSYARHVSLRA